MTSADELERRAKALAEQVTETFPVPFVLLYRAGADVHCAYVGAGADLLDMAAQFARILRENIRERPPTCNVCGRIGPGYETLTGEVRCALVGCQGWVR